MSILGGSTLTWLGHATVHLKTAAGTSVMIDPWITGNPKSPDGAEEIEKIDLMLLTHGHSDHTGDASTLAKKHEPTVICIVELGDILESEGVTKVKSMNIGGTQRFADLEISMVEAKHSSSYVVDGRSLYAGEPTGFIVKVDGGPTIYFAGDTALFTDLKLIKDLYAPDIAVLPIGDYYTMGPQHAAIAAEWLGVQAVIPIHWGTFPALKGTPAELAAASKGNVEVLEVAPGEVLD